MMYRYSPKGGVSDMHFVEQIRLSSGGITHVANLLATVFRLLVLWLRKNPTSVLG